MTSLRGDGWLSLSVGGAAGVTVVEAALIERRFGLFRGGFLAPEHLESTTQRVGFLLVSSLSDFVAVGLLAGLTLWLAKRWGLGTVPRRFLALAIGTAPLVLADLFSYQLLSYLGDAFDLSLMWDLVGRQPREFFAVGAAHLAEPLWLISIGMAILVSLVWLLQRRFPAAPPPVHRKEPTVSILIVAVISAMGCVTVVSTIDEALAAALRRKPSAQALEMIVNRLTDFDGDGSGLGARPADMSPFDSRVHPYAIDIPGNGVDEDGIGGDLPLSAPTYTEGPPTAPSFAWKPDLILVLLESVRADVLDTVIDGRPVTPTLRDIAERGGSARLAFSHNGFTYQSRYHLFSGSLTGQRGGGTLVDDFKANGYNVGYFSGQDDSFGGPELSAGFERADAFFDARQAVSRRYSQFSTPGSLAVPASVVLEHASAFVSNTAPDRPLFVYVNFHDTHYPYHHSGIQPLISNRTLTPGDISPSNGAAVREMYMNTVANMDLMIGTLISEVTRLRGRSPAVIVTSDHGESLFDEGFLGHGYALNDAQTRVPFVAQGLPLVIRQPFGQVAVRQAIWDALSTLPPTIPKPDFAPRADVPVFQYLGSINGPRQIGQIGISGDRTVYDFRADRVRYGQGDASQRPDRVAGNGAAQFLRLVRTWEAMMLARSQSVGSR